MCTTCCACSFSACGTLIVIAVCVKPRKKQFGKPWVVSPCSVRSPPDQRSDSVTPPRPTMSYPARRVYDVPTSKPVAKIRQSTSYSLPFATTPRSVSACTPLPFVSTSSTFDRLYVCRYSSWKHGRLQNCRYHG